MSFLSMPFLRPLPAPKPAFVRSFIRRATTTAEVTLSGPLVKENPVATQTFTPAGSPPPPQSLTYHVERTGSKQLPIYHLAKRGGNLHQTRIRRISGNVQDLKQDLQKNLELQDDHIKINPLTRHIIIKGWKKHEVARFLRDKNL
ncbi:MAG: hypothetical protein MMC23_003217 [Stictis urceolatum]|nr:hypothetical protein [Stictis urceolata]